jgi:hypothetical protein
VGDKTWYRSHQVSSRRAGQWPAAEQKGPPLLRRLVLAGVPALSALLMVGSYLYLRATMPPSPVLGSRPDGTLLLRHGNLASIVWQERVSAASVLAFWLTAATLLCLVALWLARPAQTEQGCSLRLRRKAPTRRKLQQVTST